MSVDAGRYRPEGSDLVPNPRSIVATASLRCWHFDDAF